MIVCLFWSWWTSWCPPWLPIWVRFVGAVLQVLFLFEQWRRTFVTMSCKACFSHISFLTSPYMKLLGEVIWQSGLSIFSMQIKLSCISWFWAKQETWLISSLDGWKLSRYGWKRRGLIPTRWIASSEQSCTILDRSDLKPRAPSALVAYYQGAGDIVASLDLCIITSC